MAKPRPDRSARRVLGLSSGWLDLTRLGSVAGPTTNLFAVAVSRFCYPQLGLAWMICRTQSVAFREGIRLVSFFGSGSVINRLSCGSVINGFLRLVWLDYGIQIRPFCADGPQLLASVDRFATFARPIMLCLARVGCSVCVVPSGDGLC